MHGLSLAFAGVGGLREEGMASHKSLLQHQEAKSEACNPRQSIASIDHYYSIIVYDLRNKRCCQEYKGSVMENLENEGFCCAPSMPELPSPLVLSV